MSDLSRTVVRILGTGVVAIATVAWFGYLTGIQGAVSWGVGTQVMPLPTATSLVLVGISLIVLAGRK